MSKSFYLILPSNTKCYATNRPNSFKVHLPKPLVLSDGEWQCGLSGIQYQHSWATLGSSEKEHIDVYMKNDQRMTIPIPRGAYTTPQDLEMALSCTTHSVSGIYENFTKYKPLIDTLHKRNRKRRAIIKSDKSKKSKSTVSGSVVEDVESVSLPPVEQVETITGEIEKLSSTLKAQEKKLDSLDQTISKNAEVVNAQITTNPQALRQSSVREVEELTHGQKEEIYNSDLFKYPPTFDPLLFPKNLPLIPKVEGPSFDGKEWTFEKMHQIIKYIRFIFLDNIKKFQLKIDYPFIEHVKLSPQLAYTLGYPLDGIIYKDQVAPYSFDLRGAASYICVYANNLTQNMILGDALSSVLRVVSVTGKPGDIIENTFDAPIFNKVMGREISEIEIELRNLEGRLIEFDYGIVIVTLCFKKAIYF